MPNNDKYDLSVTIKGENIFFEVSTLNPGRGTDDELGLDTLRIEMTTARIFHKLINYISEDKELFEKDDFKLLGEILGKIIFRGKMAQFILGNLFPKEQDPPDRVRIYLEIDNNPRLADLPWEYIQIYPLDKFEKLGEQSVYLSANEKNRFQLMRRLNKQKLPDTTADALNVILIICNGANKSEGILSRSSDSIEKVFAGLKNKYGEKFNYVTLNNPARENFANEIVAALKQFKRTSDTVPPYCIHYFGHSRLKRGTGELVFKTKTLEATWITDQDFADYLENLLTRKCNKNSDGADEADIKVDVPVQCCFNLATADVWAFASGKGSSCNGKKNVPKSLACKMK
jgi:hypothetical protein